MITITTTWTKTKTLTAIDVRGHEPAANNDINPVCAATSAVILGAINAIATKNIAEKFVRYHNESGHCSIEMRAPNDFIKSLLFVTYIQLKTIEQGLKTTISFVEQTTN